jgi:hypothetical protein
MAIFLSGNDKQYRWCLTEQAGCYEDHHGPCCEGLPQFLAEHQGDRKQEIEIDFVVDRPAHGHGWRKYVGLIRVVNGV